MAKRLIYWLAFFATPALAAPLQFPEIRIESQSSAHYRCDGRVALDVRYLNGSNRQSFAILRIDGADRLFVATLAASGVKYQADHYIWWSKGSEGNLYDLMRGENAAPRIANCQGKPASLKHAQKSR